MDFPALAPRDATIRHRAVAGALIGSGALLVPVVLSIVLLQARDVSALVRKDFAQFPTQLGEWQGRHLRVESLLAERLKFSDYLLAEFNAPSSEPVVVYVAYYESQRAGESGHSPQSCIPGGGWEISDLSRRNIDSASTMSSPLRVNRVEIQRGDDRQLVYYWFQQRGRSITSEYAVKGYLLLDALERNRTDGALVRLTTPIAPGEGWAAGDKRLAEFASSLDGLLTAYIPN